MKLTEIRFRKYASFFDWPDKEIKEVSIVHDFSLSYFGDGKVPFSRLRLAEKDPPDCVAELEDGTLVGFEVTELVDFDTVVKWEQDRSRDYKEYESDELVELIEEIATGKDNKKYLGGPYQEISLIIHTDEPFVSTQENIHAITNCVLKPKKQISKVYLMLPPPVYISGVIPEKSVNESYRIIKLNLAQPPAGGDATR
ncbi:MAG: hypothetical protein AB3N64_05005 [Puniceicoccaceae bacterium]